MRYSIKLLVLLLAAIGLLTIGNVSAQGVSNHQINLKVGGAGQENRHIPELENPAQNVLTVNRYDTMRFQFPGRPSETTITISSEEKINQSTDDGPPYLYDGRASFAVNPDEGVERIKYDVTVERSDMIFEVLDPIIVIED